MSILDINNNFKEEVLSSDKVVLVDFYADWCGPCKNMSPILEEIAKERADDLKVVKVNVESQAKVSTEYNITAMPSFLLFKNGEVIAATVGGQSKSEINSWIDDNISNSDILNIEEIQDRLDEKEFKKLENLANKIVPPLISAGVIISNIPIIATGKSLMKTKAFPGASVLGKLTIATAVYNTGFAILNSKKATSSIVKSHKNKDSNKDKTNYDIASEALGYSPNKYRQGVRLNAISNVICAFAGAASIVKNKSGFLSKASSIYTATTGLANAFKQAKRLKSIDKWIADKNKKKPNNNM